MSMHTHGPTHQASTLASLPRCSSTSASRHRAMWRAAAQAGRLLGDCWEILASSPSSTPRQALLRLRAPPPASASVGRAEAVLLIGGAAVSCNPTTLTLTLTL
jgi:hypothetical protein